MNKLILSEEFLRMQRLAGIITESQFKNMKEAIVNTVSDNLSDIFDEKTKKLKPEVKNNIIKGLDIIKKQFPDLKIIDHFIVGAAVTYQYEDGSDIDTTVVLDPTVTKEKSKEGFLFMEGCLSIPSSLSKPTRTIRACKVVVDTDNLGELTFEINPEGDKANESISKETMMTVIVQHEIDHLDGFTIKDRVYNTQVVKKVDFGRNEKIVMKSKEGEMVEVKFKNANKLFLQGYEIV